MYATFQKWLENMPSFRYFIDLKKRFSGKVPMNLFLMDKKTNRFSGRTFYKMRSQKELLEVLIQITNDTCKRINEYIYSNKHNTDRKDNLIKVAEEKMKTKSQLLFNDNMLIEEVKYSNIIVNWLDIVIEYYKVVNQNLTIANVETFIEQSLSNDNLMIDNQKYMIQLQLTEFNKIKGRFDKLHDDIDNHVNLLSVELNKIIIPNISIFSNRIDLWLPNSDKLASNGKQYLISAEYLYDYITTLGENEYSPFVHQYCRTIENELKDLFKSYNQDIRSRKSQDDIDALAVAETASGIPRSQRHGGFTSKVKSNEISNFKNMIDILRKVNVATTLLFADFKIYIQNRYDLSIILDNTLLDEIDFIRDEYRNQAAHPFDETILLNNVKADECKAKVKVVLNKWISGKK